MGRGLSTDWLPHTDRRRCVLQPVGLAQPGARDGDGPALLAVGTEREAEAGDADGYPNASLGEVQPDEVAQEALALAPGSAHRCLPF